MPIPTQLSTQTATRIVRFQGGGLRFLDARGGSVVTRPRCDRDDGQHWRVTDIGAGVSTIEHVGSGRFLDADPELHVTTRVRDLDDAQRWRIEDFGGGFAAIEHVGNGRFLEATTNGDFAVVMKHAGGNEQTWRIGDP